MLQRKTFAKHFKGGYM